MADILHYGSRGPRVKDLQRLINDNPYWKPGRKLVVDGQFGPLTAAACQKSKYWLGYAKDDIKPIAGAWLFALLGKDKPLPPQYVERRKARIAKRNQLSDQDKLRLRALAIIKQEYGTIEKPYNSNHIKYNEWWGWGNVAYCVIGVSWAWVKAGSTSFKRGVRWANTDAMLADAARGRNGLHLTHNPQPGTPGVIDFEGHSDPDHCITFLKDNGDGTCQTIEFNTRNDGGIGGVWKERRPLRQCWWFGVEE